MISHSGAVGAGDEKGCLGDVRQAAAALPAFHQVQLGGALAGETKG
jgi:hypothetical protein